MDIKRNGSRSSSEGPRERFTGKVRVEPLFQANAPGRAQGAKVTFEPSARTAWHNHPLGQTLIVTDGRGCGGKSAPWQANPPSPSGDTPVESFCCWASDPHLRSVPGTVGQHLILTCTKSRTLTTVSKKPIRTVPFPPLEAFRGVILADRIDPEDAFEPKPLLREDEGDDSGRRQAPENLDSCTDCTLISRAPQPPWRRAPRTPRGRRPCRRAPNRPLLPR